MWNAHWRHRMPVSWSALVFRPSAARCSSNCGARIVALTSTTHFEHWPRCRCWRARCRRHERHSTPYKGDAMTLKDKTAVVGIGATPYYRRGESLPQTELELAGKAILAALDDARLTVRDLDGVHIYSSSCDPAQVASVLGVPEVRFAATLTSGGGGAAGSLGLAAAAITSGQAEVCVTLMTLQQAKRRLGGSAVGGGT